MTPGEIRGKTLSELRRARKNMMSAEWLDGVKDLPEPERAAAAMGLLEVCLAIRRLENQGVAAIRQQLAESERELRKGLHGLERAGKRLQRIKTYLKAATALTTAVGKIVGPL